MICSLTKSGFLLNRSIVHGFYTRVVSTRRFFLSLHGLSFLHLSWLSQNVLDLHVFPVEQSPPTSTLQIDLPSSSVESFSHTSPDAHSLSVLSEEQISSTGTLQNPSSHINFSLHSLTSAQHSFTSALQIDVPRTLR